MNAFARHRLLFFHRPCAQEPAAAGEVGFELVDGEHFPWERHPSKEYYPVYRARLLDGHRAMIGEAEGEIAFTAWIAGARLRIDELRCDWSLPEDAAVIYDVVTEARWRGRGIYPDALRRIAGMLSGEGYRDLWIYAEADNAASLRGIQKAGFAERGSAGSVILAGIVLRRRGLGDIPGLCERGRNTSSGRGHQ